jgi:hypothetical protein
MIHLQMSIRGSLDPGEAKRTLANTSICVPEPKALRYIPRNRLVDSPEHLLVSGR